MYAKNDFMYAKNGFIYAKKGPRKAVKNFI